MSDYKLTKESQVKGGHARALSLSPKERSDIARRAAEARWGSKPRKNGKRRTAEG